MPTQTGVPAPRGPAGHPQEGSSPDPARLAWLGDPETLLLVEDDAGDVLLVEELLADSGMRATLSWARSLAEAKEQLKRGGATPGCVLLDLHLPDAQGLEAVTQMLAAAPGAPVVVLTGLAEESAGLAAVAAGAQDYLIKGQSAPGRVRPRDPLRRRSASTSSRPRPRCSSARCGRRRTPGWSAACCRPRWSAPPRSRWSARYRPGRAQALLGGDFYDVVETSGRHRARGHRRRLRARRRRGGDRRLPAGRLAVAGAGRRDRGRR